MRLAHAAQLMADVHRKEWEQMVEEYRSLAAGQRLIASHIQYNRLWQGEIARLRRVYNDQTALDDAVLERQALLDALADCLRALGDIAERRLTGAFNLFNPDLVTLKDVVLAIGAAVQRRSFLVPVPSSLLVGPLWLLGRAGVTLPVNLDNLRGWRANLSVRDRSDLPAFVARPLTLAEMVQAARQMAPG